MKKLILLLVFLSISIYGQSWNSIIPTSISAVDITHIENFANKDGIHLVVYRDIYGGNKEIDYYLINTAGTLIRSSVISTNGKYPNVVGDNSSVYLVYKEADKIRVKKSTDAGQNWIDKLPKTIGNNPCSGVDAVFDVDGIQTVWSVSDQNNQNSEIYYEKYDTQSNIWKEYKNVTDYTNGYGVYPTVSISANRVHVGYNSESFYDGIYPSTTNAQEMSRTKYNTTWQTQQQIASVSNSGEIYTASSNLYDFYYDIVSGGGQYSSNLYFRHRTIGSSTWSTSTLLENGSDYTVPLSVCTTANGYLHAFNANAIGKVSEDIIINGTINSIAEVSNGDALALYSSAVYNDIYLNWSGYSGYVNLRQYNASPEAPQNFAGQNNNDRPKLTWTANKAPDIANYEVWRQMRFSGQRPGNWVLLATTQSTSFVDNGIFIGSGGAGTAKYKIKAKDTANLYSGYTSIVSFSFGGLNKTVFTEDATITEFKILQNYPNPFNPSTQIEFQIPKNGFVNLTVYNSLGQKVKELVNSNLSIGKYSLDFNAENLPSGIYIYRIKSQNFSQSKKMILTK